MRKDKIYLNDRANLPVSEARSTSASSSSAILIGVAVGYSIPLLCLCHYQVIFLKATFFSSTVVV